MSLLFPELIASLRFDHSLRLQLLTPIVPSTDLGTFWNSEFQTAKDSEALRDITDVLRDLGIKLNEQSKTTETDLLKTDRLHLDSSQGRRRLQSKLKQDEFT